MKSLFFRDQNKGFTVVELLLVVAILGILAGVAVPLYLGQRTRSMHAEAKSSLESIRVLEEQRFSELANYGTASSTVTYTSGSTTLQTLLPGFKPGPAASLKFDYSLTIGDPPNTFTATATGRTGTPVEGTVFTIDQDNNKNY